MALFSSLVFLVTAFSPFPYSTGDRTYGLGHGRQPLSLNYFLLLPKDLKYGLKQTHRSLHFSLPDTTQWKGLGICGPLRAKQPPPPHGVRSTEERAQCTSLLDL